jgi:hypothetical protein
MLKLLLDEHISKDVARGLRERSRDIVVHAMAEWEGGNFLGQDDPVCLRAAAEQALTFVTYDGRTLPPLLKAWAEEERTHGGVLFVDEKTLPQADIGGLVKALAGLHKETEKWDWTNRIVLLHR